MMRWVAGFGKEAAFTGIADQFCRGSRSNPKINFLTPSGLGTQGG